VAGVGPSSEPQLDRLVAELEQHLTGGLAGLRQRVDERRSQGEPWPHPVPAELREGIGAAQFLAVRDGLVARLQLAPAARVRPESSAPLTGQDRRLLDEVPPHSVG